MAYEDSYQERFFAVVQKLMAPDLDLLQATDFPTSTADPDNPLLTRPNGQQLYQKGPITNLAYDILTKYFDACSAADDVTALYGLLLKLQLNTNELGEYAAGARALEYAIWDAKYRFTELCFGFLEAAVAGCPYEQSANLIERKNKLRKLINSCFLSVKRSRGFNTHEAAITIRVAADLSTLGLLSRYGDTARLFEDGPVAEFLRSDIRRRVRNYRSEKRKSFKGYETLMSQSIGLTCRFVLEHCKYETLVDLALSEDRPLTFPPPSSPARSATV